MNFFVDSSGWVGLFDPSDKYHSQAQSWMQSIIGQGHRFITTDYVLDETITDLQAAINHATAESFVDWILIQKHVQVVHITEAVWDEALAMFRKYDDKSFSFTDCTSFTVMGKMKLREAFAFDHHFEQMGFRLWPR